MNQSHYDAHQQQWNQQQVQAEYNEAPVSMMEMPVVEQQQQQQHSDWQTPHTSIQEPYKLAEHSDQYSGTNLDSGHYQQPQQQDYWNQQNYNQQEYAAQDWQQSSQYSADQTEIDNNQQQGNWGYEVSAIFHFSYFSINKNSLTLTGFVDNFVNFGFFYEKNLFWVRLLYFD